MAEMIIQKVDALDGTKKPEVKTPKFRVGDCIDRVFYDGNTEPYGKVVGVVPNFGGTDMFGYKIYLTSDLGDSVGTYPENVLALSTDELKVEDRVWHSGPPPSIGWWNASVKQDRTAWRWWNGKGWSLVAYESADYVGYVENSKCHQTNDIKWSDYYPENARVPRIDLNK